MNVDEMVIDKEVKPKKVKMVKRKTSSKKKVKKTKKVKRVKKADKHAIDELTNKMDTMEIKNDFRNKIVKLYNTFLHSDSIASDIEDGLFNRFKSTNQQYRDQARNIIFNLRDKTKRN